MIRRLMCAAVIALVGFLAGCAASAQAGSSGVGTYQGHRWRITEVRNFRSPSYDIRLSSSDHAWIAFDHFHHLTAYDLVQHYALSYRATDDGFLPNGYRGTGGWMVSQRDERISNSITSVIGDKFHTVKVNRLPDGSMTFTAFFHDGHSDPTWQPVMQLVCRRDDSPAPDSQSPSDSTFSSPSS